MSWLELDDRILEHPKFIRAIKLAGSEAVHLWLGIRAYCGQNLTDGFVPEDMLDEVRGPSDPKKRAKALAALRTVGLLDEATGGVQMHDYLDWSSSRDDVLKRRESARERKQRSRAPSTGTPEGQPVMSRRDVARTDSERRAESPTPAGASPLPLPLPSKPDLTAAANPRPESLPRAPAPEAAAAAASGSGLPEPASGTHRTAPEKRVDTQVRERLPGNLADALRVPVCERAMLVTGGRVDAQWLEPEKWPEVLAVAKALAEGEGREPRPRARYHADAGVRAVVELYAAGYVPGDLVAVARKLPKQRWWHEGDRRRGLSTLSVEVVDRALTDAPEESDGRALLAAVDADLAKAGKRSEPGEGATSIAALVAGIGRSL